MFSNFYSGQIGKNLLIFDAKVTQGMWKMHSSCPEKQIEENFVSEETVILFSFKAKFDRKNSEFGKCFCHKVVKDALFTLEGTFWGSTLFFQINRVLNFFTATERGVSGFWWLSRLRLK